MSSSLSDHLRYLVRAFSSRTEKVKETTVQPPSPSSLSEYENSDNISGRIIWAAACDFQQFGILTSVDSDEPLQPSLKLRNS